MDSAVSATDTNVNDWFRDHAHIILERTSCTPQKADDRLVANHNHHVYQAMLKMNRRDKETGLSQNLCPRKTRLHHVGLAFVVTFVLLNGASLYRASYSSSSTTKPAKLPATKNPESQEVSPCYTDACIEVQASKLAQAWQRHSRHSWCVNTTLPTPLTTHSSKANGMEPTTGLWLIKVPKSASSTMTGIVLRIAELYQCPVRWHHAKAVDVFSSQHARNHTFRVAPIRHPHTRSLSSVYYHAVSLQAGRRQSNNNNSSTPADAYVLRQLARIENNYITDYTRPPTHNAQHDGNNKITSSYTMVREILQAYDFLVVVEDLAASLVVWAWLADLELTDVLIMSSKTTGSWYATKPHHCVALIPPIVTPAVADYWQRGLGRSQHYMDRLLHATARQSLQATIEHGMGRTLFRQRLQEFQDWQATVQRDCGVVMNTSAPCSPTGMPQPNVAEQACYVRDFGCGHECVNRVVKQEIQK